MNIPITQSPVFRLQNGPWSSVTQIKAGKFLLLDRNRLDQFPLSLKCGKYAGISRHLQRCRFSKFSKDGKLLGWRIIFFLSLQIKADVIQYVLKTFYVKSKRKYYYQENKLVCRADLKYLQVRGNFKEVLFGQWGTKCNF